VMHCSATCLDITACTHLLSGAHQMWDPIWIGEMPH
jgi:hypothetical protein